jgi:uncharacterized membrane protein (UPF0127 family)
MPLALVLAACGPTGQGGGQQPDQGAAGPALSTPGTTPITLPPKIEGNPNRVHQLKDLEKYDQTIKGKPFHLWVMDSDAKQQEGMMFLTDAEVKADEGMLFAFTSPQPTKYPNGNPRGFWMQNTLIPLDIIYLSPQGKVLNIGKGQPRNETTVPAAGEFLNVVELKGGTAARLGLKPGDTIEIPKILAR